MRSDRGNLVAQKTKEVQAHLETWVQEHSLLATGERIVFSLHIEGVETVVHQNKRAFLDLLVREFFTRKRLLACGAPTYIVSRVRNCLWNEFQHCDHQGFTMREFIADERFTKRELLFIPNFGHQSVDIVEKVMESVGITLREE